jgi:sulfatase modifying factor 1
MSDTECLAVRNMILVRGGTFEMGDVLGECGELERPVHEVTLSDYHLDKYEVTAAEFKAFVEATGYRTSAEATGGSSQERGGTGSEPDETKQPNDRLASAGGWVIDKSGASWASDASWRNPHFEQTERDPVTCVSWKDAISYCNWLSKLEGIPPAYDVNAEELLDGDGKSTTDVTKAKGYRLPTEAEWEYAARERGRKVRFGNGQDVARSSEINFDATTGDWAYLEKGDYRAKTVPVGSFKPNSLGLHDMSGNVWEWCSDFMGKYGSEPQVNPYQLKGVESRRAARGGIWAGSARFARVSVRFGWTSSDRCNNIGFRIAKSK